MPLLGPAIVFVFAAVVWIVLVRQDGGWAELDRSRRGQPTREGTTQWMDLTPTARMWVRLVPFLLGAAAVLIVAAILIEV